MKTAQPTTTTKTVAKGKSGAKRHQRKDNNPPFTAADLKHIFSEEKVKQFGYRGCALSIEWKKNIRLIVGLTYSSILIDTLRDVGFYAMQHAAAGKPAIIGIKDVMAVFEPKGKEPGKGRKRIYGVINQREEKARKEKQEMDKAMAAKKKRLQAEADRVASTVSSSSTTTTETLSSQVELIATNKRKADEEEEQDEKEEEEEAPPAKRAKHAKEPAPIEPVAEEEE